MTILRKQENKKENGQGLLKDWIFLSNLWNYRNPIKSLITYEESINAFDSFVILWDEYKKTSDFQTCPIDIQSAINEMIDEIKNEIDE